MDLIFLQPGDKSIVQINESRNNSSSLTDQLDVTLPKLGNLQPTFDKKNCIELISVHQGIKQQLTTDVSNSARTSGRPIITEFTCVKYVDKTSVKLYDYCLRAETIGKGKDSPSYIFILRNTGDKRYNIMTFAMRDAIISEIQMQSHPDDMPTEQFKLNFTEIMWVYSEQIENRQETDNMPTGWSLARNRPITEFI